MMGVGEHINRLYLFYFVFNFKKSEVPCLRSRITAYVDNSPGFSKKDCVNYVVMHSGTGRVGDDYIRFTMQET